MAHFSRVAAVVIDVPDGDHDRKRLEDLGAQRVDQARTWYVLRDPGGLLFCVIPEPGGTLNDNNARRWE